MRRYPVDIRMVASCLFVATLPDMPLCAAEGIDPGEAVRALMDVFRDAVSELMADRQDIPEPSPAGARQFLMPLSLQWNAKIDLYKIWRSSGKDKSALAADARIEPHEVRAAFDLRHKTQVSRLERVANGLGREMVISFESAG
jgi:antitoxin HicB